MARVRFVKISDQDHPFNDGETVKVCSQTVVVGGDIQTAAGRLDENPTHIDGETWCQNFFKGGEWKAYSREKTFRTNVADAGMWYLSDQDMFVPPQPFNSWTLNTQEGTWECPVSEPTWEQREFTNDQNETEYYAIFWDETNQRWLGSSVSKFIEDANFYWDTSTSSWTAL